MYRSPHRPTDSKELTQPPSYLHVVVPCHHSSCATILCTRGCGITPRLTRWAVALQFGLQQLDGLSTLRHERPERLTMRMGDSGLRPQNGKQGSGARKSTSTSNLKIPIHILKLSKNRVRLEPNLHLYSVPRYSCTFIVFERVGPFLCYSKSFLACKSSIPRH